MAYLIREHRAALATIRLTNPGLLLLAIAIHSAFWIVSSAFWRYSVLVTTRQTLSMNESFRQLALVAIGKYIPGKVWGLVARGTALKQSDANARGIIAATLIEQWVMFMSAGLVGGLLLLQLRPDGIFGALAIGAIIVSLSGNYFFRFGASVFHRVLRVFLDTDESSNDVSIRHSEYLVLLLMHTLMWVLIGSVLACIFFAFSLRPFSFELCAALVLANTTGIVMGFIALFAPGGIGVREAMTTAVLLPYIPLEQAATLSVVFRVWTSSIDAFLALALVLQSALSRRVRA